MENLGQLCRPSQVSPNPFRWVVQCPRSSSVSTSTAILLHLIMFYSSPRLIVPRLPHRKPGAGASAVLTLISLGSILGGMAIDVV